MKTVLIVEANDPRVLPAFLQQQKVKDEDIIGVSTVGRMIPQSPAPGLPPTMTMSFIMMVYVRGTPDPEDAKNVVIEKQPATGPAPRAPKDTLRLLDFHRCVCGHPLGAFSDGKLQHVQPREPVATRQDKCHQCECTRAAIGDDEVVQDELPDIQQ